MLGLHFTPACVLPSVCSLHFTLSLHFTPGPQSAVRSPQSAFYTDQIIFSRWSHKEELHYGISKLGNKGKQNHIIVKKHKSHDCFSMKNKWCLVRMLPPNKSCSKDNLDQVIDVQQYNPLIHQQLRESKIQAVIHILYATTEGPRGKSTQLFQAVVQHNVRLNGKLLREEPRNMVQQLLERPSSVWSSWPITL